MRRPGSKLSWQLVKAYVVFVLNVEVRHSWAYTDLIPRLRLVGTVLSPHLQWLVLPVSAFAVMRRVSIGKPQ